MSFLDSLKILSDLNQKEKEKLSLFSQEKFLKKWEILFSEWDEAVAIYILKTWKIQIFKNFAWKKIVLWNIFSEEILWEMFLFWKTKKRMASAVAKEDCKLITILSFSIEKLTKKYPKLKDKLSAIIKQRLSINKKIINTIKK